MRGLAGRDPFVGGANLNCGKFMSREGEDAITKETSAQEASTYTEEEHAAVTRIQAIQRGRTTRRNQNLNQVLITEFNHIETEEDLLKERESQAEAALSPTTRQGSSTTRSATPDADGW